MGTRRISVFGNTLVNTETLTLSADSSATDRDMAALPNDCTDDQTISGITWSATASDLTFVGSPMCTGGITCDGGMGPCDTTGFDTRPQPYTLSADGMTLTLGEYMLRRQ
jgi:hypothetical protein